MKVTYQAICQKIKETGKFQMISLEAGQFRDEVDVRLLPAVLIEFQLTNVIRMSGGRKVADAIITVRVLGELFEDPDALSPQHDAACDYFLDLIEVVDDALNGIKVDGEFEALQVREVTIDPEYTNMFAHKIVYETQIYFGKEISRMESTLANIELEIDKN
jgi:hypothetical protein